MLRGDSADRERILVTPAARPSPDSPSATGHAVHDVACVYARANVRATGSIAGRAVDWDATTIISIAPRRLGDSHLLGPKSAQGEQGIDALNRLWVAQAMGYVGGMVQPTRLQEW